MRRVSSSPSRHRSAGGVVFPTVLASYARRRRRRTSRGRRASGPQRLRRRPPHRRQQLRVAQRHRRDHDPGERAVTIYNAAYKQVRGGQPGVLDRKVKLNVRVEQINWRARLDVAHRGEARPDMTTSSERRDEGADARDCTRLLLEALGASADAVRPVPFVDDWMQARLLRRVRGEGARSPRARVGHVAARDSCDAYVKEGASGSATFDRRGAARFIGEKSRSSSSEEELRGVRESIAFAIALDVGAARGWAHDTGAARSAVRCTGRYVSSARRVRSARRAGKDAAQGAQGGGSCSWGRPSVGNDQIRGNRACSGRRAAAT